MYLDIISFTSAIAAICLGYRICVARVKQKPFSEMKLMVFFFVISIILLWFINFYTVFIQ